MGYSNVRKACNVYKKTDVTSLTPVQIVSRLYEALERDLVQARSALIAGEKKGKGEFLSHGLAIIGELQAGLDLEKGGEIAENLHSLYVFVISEISKANLSNQQEGLDTAIKTIKPLAEAWSELAGEKKEPMDFQFGARPVPAVGAAVAFNATF